jgi:predicted peptidase
MTTSPCPASSLVFSSPSCSTPTSNLPYAVYLPEHYENQEQQWPLLVYLHSAATRGDDGHSQLERGLYPSVQRHPELYPALILFPQLPRHSSWAEYAEPTCAAILEVMEKYRVDKSRVYLTGTSLGGQGCWEVAQHDASISVRFAAMMPVASARMGITVPARIPKTLVVHGTKDEVWAYWKVSRAMEQLKAQHRPVELHAVEEGTHSLSEVVFEDSNLIRWLFCQKAARRLSKPRV